MRSNQSTCKLLFERILSVDSWHALVLDHWKGIVVTLSGPNTVKSPSCSQTATDMAGNMTHDCKQQGVDLSVLDGLPVTDRPTIPNVQSLLAPSLLGFKICGLGASDGSLGR